MDFLQPRTLDEALQDLHVRSPRVLAGGTDVFPSLQNKLLLGPVLDVSRVLGLRRIERHARGWVIGAGATWSDVLKADLPPVFAALKQAAADVGSVQIQNRATVAGNICNASPAADGVPPLLILDAEVELSSLQGTRRLPLEQFILGNRKTALKQDELLTAVHVPEAAVVGKSHFLKLGARRYLVISIAMVAVRLVLDEAWRVAECAVAVGSCSPVAKRLRRLEQSLLGRRFREITIGPEVLDGLQPIGDMRATAAFRKEAVGELLARALSEAAP